MHHRYPYNSATSIIEYTTMVLIVIDMCLSFNVARFHQGILITDRRSLARNYTRILFWVDLLSVIPFDEISLAIAGLNGTKYVNNPVKAQYLSLFKLFRMVRCTAGRGLLLLCFVVHTKFFVCVTVQKHFLYLTMFSMPVSAVQLRMYRLWWFFSYLTYNLAAPLILVTILRNLYLTYFFANFAACTWYFEARQAGLGVNTWVGGYTALAQLSDGIGDMFHQSSAADMYAWSMYWSVVTMATLGYGDIRAYNTVEAVLVMVWSLFSFFFAAYIIGSITLVVVKGDEKAGLYRDQMQVLQKFSAQHDLPEDIGESMLRHLKLHLNNQHISEEAVLAPYPTSIRRQVLRYLYLPALDQAYLFAGAKKRFLDALLAAARVEL